jgi:hypothetical protein
LFEASGQAVPELSGPQIGTATHWALEQNCPVGQTVPHSPQLALSSKVSRQTEPQQTPGPEVPPHGSIAWLALQLSVTQKPEERQLSPAWQLDSVAAKLRPNAPQ